MTLEPYRTIGPFDPASLPKGLLDRHSLKAGTWARLELLEGEIAFVWEGEDDRAADLLRAPATLLIPPEDPHHLRPEGHFRLQITFLRQAAAAPPL